jgi:hypothetical protein
MIGIRTAYAVAANIAVTNSTTLVTTGLTSPVAANQRQHIRAFIPFSVGAAGGVRAQIVVPGGGTLFNATVKLFNTVAPSLTTATQSSSAAFTNAAANAGTHWLEIEATIINGATAGVIDIQMAQNTGDNTPMTVLAGAWMEVTTG